MQPPMTVACIWFEKPASTSQIAELFLRLSPQIAILKDQAIFVEIGKCRVLYSEESFLARAMILIRKGGPAARIHFGTDIIDSLAFARHQRSSMEKLPLEALIDLTDPFHRDEVLRKSVFALIAAFQDLGIKDLGQFQKIPVSQLISRFGVVGRFCHSRARLLEPTPWPRWTPEETISETREFPFFEFYGELEPILFELKSQLDRIFSRLFSRRLRMTKLQIHIRCEKTSMHRQPDRTLDFHFFAPQGSAKGTLRIIKERLSREFAIKPIRSPIEAITSKVLKTVPFEGGQKNIFNSDEEKFEQLHSIHNQLIELIGAENIFHAELTEDRRPERGWRKKSEAPHEKSTAVPDLASLLPERPTYLCPKPIRIEVTAGFVHIRKKRYRILNWDDQVEKISGGWFENPTEEMKNTYDRNYYHVELEGNQRITIFQTVERDFYLHGYYG